MSNSHGQKDRAIKVDAVFHGQQQGQDLPSTRAYLFNRAGQLVQSEPLTKDSLTFHVDTDQVYRVTIGPDLLAHEKGAPPDLSDQLAKAHAVNQDIVPALRQNALHFRISNHIWLCWWQTCIQVHGTVRKLLNPGDPNPNYATICMGTVQIFQVDLDCTLDRVASFDVLSFRDRLVDRVRGVALDAKQAAIVRRPFPGPPPELSIKQTQAKAVAIRSATQRSTTTSSLAEIAATLPVLDGVALKQYVIANKAILWPFWCELIPDEWFCWQELGEVAIQSDGSFSAEICFWCPQDFPDLYFEVVQNVNGTEREIYDPQIACSTYYDYDGSQSVDIIASDPAAVACVPSNPGPTYLYVWPTAIGNIDLRNIDGLETGLGSGLLPGNTPWGGTLCLQMQFHPDLQSNNIKYYRWSYKFDGDVSYAPITATVTHRYMTVDYSMLPLIIIRLNPVTLGPQTVGANNNLFAIPDPYPPGPWIDIDDPEDRPFAYFDSTGGVTPRRSGMCTLLLEMFDGGGMPVPCDNLVGGPTFKFILPDLGGPPNSYTNAPAPNVTSAGQLTYRVRVDNNSTVAQLPGVSTAEGSANECGFLNYQNLNELVYIAYVATHPFDYLDWWLGVWRGLAGEVRSASGHTSSPPMSLPAPSTAGSFNNTAAALLGDCARAAFAVNLYCAARAQSGYGRQSQYDSSATIAFALTPP